LIVDFEVWLDKANTRYWLAPELLLSEPFPYGSEVDIWGLGCIIIEMADGTPPYSHLHPLKEFFYTATRGAPTLAEPEKYVARNRIVAVAVVGWGLWVVLTKWWFAWTWLV
jgi:serine/threonine protein kinase